MATVQGHHYGNLPSSRYEHGKTHPWQVARKYSFCGKQCIGHCMVSRVCQRIHALQRQLHGP